jgi:hypothetical protein
MSGMELVDKMRCAICGHSQKNLLNQGLQSDCLALPTTFSTDYVYKYFDKNLLRKKAQNENSGSASAVSALGLLLSARVSACPCAVKRIQSAANL